MIRINTAPVTSASAHPMGIAHQTAPTPKTGAKAYASATLVPREITVSNREIFGLSTARKYPYSRNKIPIPQ